jgi:methylated-DNA-[protein]-cysteine S-methyltransferase
VWQTLLAVPYGSVVSYKQIAEIIGHPKAYRAVGTANHNNPIAIIVPCHRVIAANGALGGYGAGLSAKQYLLDLERRNINN